MKKVTLVLIGILVLGGFGIFGFVVGENFKQASITEKDTENAQGIPSIITQHPEIRINS
jgi:hypothetical protein